MEGLKVADVTPGLENMPQEVKETAEMQHHPLSGINKRKPPFLFGKLYSGC